MKAHLQLLGRKILCMYKFYIVNYDLRDERNYPSLYDALNSYRECFPILESCFIVKSNKSATQIKDHLFSKMDVDDGIFVGELDKDFAFENIKSDDQELNFDPYSVWQRL